jgi:acyl-CoA thioester hydrolase
MLDLAAIPAPFDGFSTEIRREWIDYNGHMNVAYYVLIFDRATDAFWDALGIGEAYVRRTNNSTFMLESHITYQGEVKLGDRVRCTAQILGVDAKRLHVLHRMYHAEKGYLASTMESLSLHVSLETRRSAPFPVDRKQVLDRVVAAHARLGVPEEAGRRVSLSRKSGPSQESIE